MTHIELIATAYVLAVGGPFVLMISAMLRVRVARRRLAAVEGASGRRSGRTLVPARPPAVT